MKTQIDPSVLEVLGKDDVFDRKIRELLQWREHLAGGMLQCVDSFENEYFKVLFFQLSWINFDPWGLIRKRHTILAQKRNIYTDVYVDCWRSFRLDGLNVELSSVDVKDNNICFTFTFRRFAERWKSRVSVPVGSTSIVNLCKSEFLRYSEIEGLFLKSSLTPNIFRDERPSLFRV